MNYRALSDKEVIARAETLTVIPQDLAHELLYRLKRTGAGMGSREDVIVPTYWYTGTPRKGPHHVRK